MPQFRTEEQEEEESIFTLSQEGREIYFATMERQREWLRKETKNNPLIDEEITKHYLLKLDLEEERLRIE